MTHKKIKLLRVANNITQKEMAEKFGYTRNWYVELEKGSRKPTDKEIKYFAKLNKVTPAEFVADPKLTIFCG